MKATFKDIAKTIIQAVKNGITITIAAENPSFWGLPVLKFRMTRGMLKSDFIMNLSQTIDQDNVLWLINRELQRRCGCLTGTLQPEEEALIDRIGGAEDDG